MRGISTSRLIVVAALVVAACTATTVWAAAPGDEETISACYAKKGGKLRVVKAGKTCKKRERALDWNRAGPPGVSGAKGPAGPKGSKGDPGTPSVAYSNDGGGLLDTTTGTEVASLELPAGKYVLMGKSISTNMSDETGAAWCIVDSSAGDVFGVMSQTVPAGESATIAAQRAVEMQTAATISIVCSDLVADEAIDLTTTFTAVPVGNVILQQQ